ncbi:MAG: ribosome silencing factor [Victivallales bacterium]|nr:ribosome silencing factor [Victivallales bacterium]
METTEKKIDPSDFSALADKCVSVIEDGKGGDILKLDVSDLSVLADCFILCTANSTPHLKALSQRLRKEVSRATGTKPHMDGAVQSAWMVLDYGNVVVHVLTPEMREKYQLEELWGDNSEIRAFLKEMND